MNLRPALFRTRPLDDDLSPPVEPDDAPRDEIFRLIPPRAESLEAAFSGSRVAAAEPTIEPAGPSDLDAALRAERAEKPGKLGRNRHGIGAMDLTRLSIDDDGRLYWDGKPVEVRRRLMMSRGQAIGATFIAVCVAIAALGAAVQGSLAAHEWACKLGWAASGCGAPAAAPMRPGSRFDIPA